MYLKTEIRLLSTLNPLSRIFDKFCYAFDEEETTSISNMLSKHI